MKTNPDTRDRDGRTALHMAAFDNNADFVSELIAGGAQVDAQDKLGYTPLHMAAQQYATAAVATLLRGGARVDVEDKHGNTPLWTAVFNSKGGGEVIRLLREAGADPRHRNRYGRTALDMARVIANYDIARYFADLE